ncbi:MAG: YezD family protein [Eubacterium sp.]|nr:YezD family protein [Eubacterium sp.]
MAATSEKRALAIKQCLKEIEEILNSELKYGSINIIIQDGIPIQIDTTEKRRFN